MKFLSISGTLLSALAVVVLIAIHLTTFSIAYPVTTSRKSDLFYIYDSPQWQTISNVSQTVRDPAERIENYKNGGAGDAINITRGSYHTDQYQLYLLVFSRALKDPRRTLDPSKATTFIIPYDLATDAAYYKNCSRSSEICFDFRKCPLAPTVNELVLKSPWYKRNYGKDHLLIIGMNYAMNHFIGKPKCKAFLTGACYNCTKIAIDDYAYLHPNNIGAHEKGDNWHAIPFPADFHWTKNVAQPFPWDNLDRPYLSSYMGTDRSHYGPARKLRIAIAHFCRKHGGNICIHNSYGGNNSSRSSFKIDGFNPSQVSLNSIFCFQPIGDVMTRKGLFDSILQGCIPVTFDPLTASSMYTWHWEEEFWLDVTIQLDFQSVTSKRLDPVVVLKDLMKYNKTYIVRIQKLIRSRVFELQYSLDGKYEAMGIHNINSNSIQDNTNSNNINPSNNNSSSDSLSNSNTNISSNSNSNSSFLPIFSKEVSSNWPLYPDGTPMRDAYDLIMDHILGWHSGQEPDVRNGSVPECWNALLDIKANKCVSHPKV